jgi:hypothetical protein
VIGTGLTRGFKLTMLERVQRDPAFARAMLDEAATLFLSGEPRTARLILRDLVNATVGFEGLATATAMPGKSLHRLLLQKGNPSMDNLAASSVPSARRFVSRSRLTPSKRRKIGSRDRLIEAD